jgi:hypothetical protein
MKTINIIRKKDKNNQTYYATECGKYLGFSPTCDLREFARARMASFGIKQGDTLYLKFTLEGRVI